MGLLNSLESILSSEGKVKPNIIVYSPGNCNGIFGVYPLKVTEKNLEMVQSCINKTLFFTEKEAVKETNRRMSKYNGFKYGL